jgi:hypothetical protein
MLRGIFELNGRLRTAEKLAFQEGDEFCCILIAQPPASLRVDLPILNNY